MAVMTRLRPTDDRSGILHATRVPARISIRPLQRAVAALRRHADARRLTRSLAPRPPFRHQRSHRRTELLRNRFVVGARGMPVACIERQRAEGQRLST